MSPVSLLPCRHRAESSAAGVYDCGSPKLTGLKLVTAAVCGVCCYRDLEAAPPQTPPPRLLPCAYWGARADLGCPGCRHPGHAQATAAECDTCVDYLFPVLTPQTPVSWVRRLLDLPPAPQPEGWWRWANVQEAYRRAAADHIRRAAASLGGEGRGVVVVGGGNYFASAYVAIRILRHVGCRLPVELWHLAGEIDEPRRRLLRPYEVECVDADAVAVRHPYRFLEGHWWKGWQLKPYALAHSRFREVLFLDADSYPTRDPSFLFDWDPYRQHGAIFWPDCGTSAHLLPSEKWHIFGTELREPPFESGQMVIDKGRCEAELQLTLWYNAHADFVYRVLWGDKDTFNMAWRRLGRDYAMPRPTCGWDTHTILQYGPDGEVLFQHRCQDKFCLGSETFASTYQPFAGNYYNPRLVHESLCFRFLEELRRTCRPGPGDPL